MLKKVNYYNEKRTPTVCLITVVFLLILSTIYFDFIANDPKTRIIQIITMIILIILLMFIIVIMHVYRNSVLDRRRDFVNYGVKFAGEIVEIRYEVWRRTGIVYFLAAVINKGTFSEEIIESARLAHRPSDVVGNTCVIYKKDYEYIIDEVVDISKHKITGNEILRVILTLLGVSALVFLFFH
ncbi:hypothetical protein M2146_002577 [Lachnospiraceae bacterium PF1-22]